ncbi:MAG: leucine-rich repeat domain-containing protein [Oscillospiraceae bacterium]|nr:leucine-rich repeat domain-containing protein [Oscillospiraceae bacterium]
MKKRLLPMILVCCMLAAWLAVYAQADDIVAKGDCGADGSNVQWTLDSKGTLTIFGKGAMANYNEWWQGGNDWWNPKTPPWVSNTNMIVSLIVNDGVTSVGKSAFATLNRLTKATFSDSILTIEDSVFYNCSNLLSFTISDNVTSIGNYAFQDCDRLTKMLIPHNVINIGSNAFKGCDVLQSVTILADTPIINASTFQDCPALKEITIPDSVAIIGENAFSGCSALKTVNFTGSESLWNDVTINSGNQPLENAKVNFDTSIESTYRINALSVSDTDGKTLTAIPTGSFLATVSITNLASSATPIILLASYTESGQYQGLMYATVEEPTGATVKITLPVDNSGGKIAQLKAFAVNSFADMTMIGNPVSFPA